MHNRSGSADSSLAIRTNPLNIRFSDGSDWVMDKYATAAGDAFADTPISTGVVKHGVASTKPGARIAKRPESAVIVAEDDGNTVPRYNVFKRPAKPASQRYRPRSQSSNTSSDSIGVTPVDAEKPALPVPPPKSAHRKCSSDILADIIKKSKAEKQQRQQGERPKTVIDASTPVSDDFDFSEEPQNQPDYMYSVPQLDSQSDYSSSAPSLNQTHDNSPDLLNPAPGGNEDDFLSLNLSHSPDLDLTSSFMKSYTNMSLPTHYSDLRPPQQAELGRKNTITSTKGYQTAQPSEKASQAAFERYNTEMSPQLEDDSPIVISEHLPPKRESVFYEDSILEEEAADDNDHRDLYSLPMSDSGQPSINSPTLSSSGEEGDNASTCVSSNAPKDDKKQDGEAKEAAATEQREDEVPVIAPLPEHKRLPLDHADRGRLFLKICGVKDISLPVDESRNPTFQLTLDNGIQCVTTYPLSMSSDYTSIDQEFELVVAEDLKLMLTLTGHKQEKKKEPEPSKPSSPATTTTAESSTTSLPSTARPSSPNKKKSMFNLFTSPKKKKQQLQNKQLASVSSPKLAAQPDQDPWEKAKGPKGEFARCYVIESQVEKEIYGQARTFALPCFAEWDSKKYRIATLQVVMMYIPKVYKQEPLPPSLSSCQKVINKALHEDSKIVSLSGFLSQEGGDCSYWRRRWFELKDGKLIGKHEDTRKVKLEIDLENDPELKVYEDPEDATLYGKRAFKIVYTGCPRGITFLSDSEQSRNQWLFVIFSVRSWLGLVTKTLRQQQDMSSN
ncbi:hypothetical protein TRICI_000446 [Trichomonascus ciferrii]|uniref:PH domain-containing protein n=1 Tax=Trichomonascus ciferrii TaxID=44093 RepID=A0A642VDG3_9ASCO|nr:hypothetical protein TRICI_000446 [Trichomonascus ciferrii]